VRIGPAPEGWMPVQVAPWATTPGILDARQSGGFHGYARRPREGHTSSS